ncbi:MAG: ABC transporter substrate-binding protein, partial [Rhizobium giardinii]
MTFRNVVTLVAVLFLSLPAPATAEEPEWHGGTATVGELKYTDGFSRFDYVNPDAPKGGNVNLTASGTFDTLNSLLAKGEIAAGMASP